MYEIFQLVSQFSWTYHGDSQSLEELEPKKYPQSKKLSWGILECPHQNGLKLHYILLPLFLITFSYFISLEFQRNAKTLLENMENCLQASS